MAEYSKENLYYVNLKNDFFNEHYIKILKGMPNGEKYLVLYLELVCESITHGGFLRYSKDIPYTIEMIASVTGTDIDIARVGIEALKSLGLIEVTEGGSLYLPKVKEMTRITTKGAEKKQLQRSKGHDGGQGVDKCPLDIRDKSLEYRDKSLDSNSDYYVNSVVSVTGIKPDKTRYKHGDAADALVKNLLKESFLTDEEASDPEWIELFDNLLSEGRDFVDIKIKSRYICRNFTTFVVAEKSKDGKPVIVNLPDYDKMPANKFRYFESAIRNNFEADERMKAYWEKYEAFRREEEEEDDVEELLRYFKIEKEGKK